MAILSRIREKSIFLIVVVGLALFAFVLDPSTLEDFFSSSKVNTVAVVDGEKISREEYAKALDNNKTNSNSGNSDMQAAKTVWEKLLREKIYTSQLEKAGVTIGENDVWSALVNHPYVQRSPEFKNELGQFDEDKLKFFLLDLKEQEDQTLRKAWDRFRYDIGVNLKRDTYNNLVNAGLGASLSEGRYQYEEENTNISADFVYIPYTTIPDSLVKVDKKEVEAYINKKAKDFQVEASRDISYVKFDVKATQEDKDAIKNTVASLIEDRADERDTYVGFKNTTDDQDFFDENESDLPYKEELKMKAQLPTVITEELLKSKEGDVFGPYEEGKFYKLTKVTQLLKRPDSVKSSHILIPFVGSQAAKASTTKTEEQAKKSADSIYRLVRRNKKKFAAVADEINTDGSKGKGGDIGWAMHTQAFGGGFDLDYARYIFDNKKGDVGVVKSAFGFHIIRIDEQKNKQNVYQLVTFGKEIIPSKETESNVFQEVEKFVIAVSKENSNFYDTARENNYITKPAIGLKVLDDRLPGTPGNNRKVVTWAFDQDTEVGDFERFDIDKGYLVVLLTGKSEKGLQRPAKAMNKVRPLLMNEKKAQRIMEKMTGATLNDIATANNVSVKNMKDITLKSPSIPGVGLDAKAVGAMYYAKENQLYTRVDGTRGVFAFIVTKKEAPTPLPNYETNRNQLAQQRKNLTVKIFQALKDAADITDDRGFYHGVNN